MRKRSFATLRMTTVQGVLKEAARHTSENSQWCAAPLPTLIYREPSSRVKRGICQMSTIAVIQKHNEGSLYPLGTVIWRIGSACGGIQ